MDFENFDRTDCTLLTKMTQLGQIPGVQHLLITESKKGSLENLLRTTDRQGYTAVHYAAQLGHLDILQLLLQHCDVHCVNTESHDRATALLLACQATYEVNLKAAVVQRLLAAGADPNLPQKDPFARPLLTVLENKWWQGARFLLEAGASAVDSDFEHDGLPPVYLAMDSLEVVELMASMGCMNKSQWHDHHLLEWLLDVTVRNPLDNVGYSANHVTALVDIIIRHNKDAVSLFSLKVAAKYGHITAMQHMLHTLTYLPTPAFEAALLAFDLAQATLPPDTVKSFLRELMQCIMVNDKSTQDREHGPHRNMMLLLLMCHKDYLEFLIEESSTVRFHVSHWCGQMMVSEYLPKVFNARVGCASVRYNYNIRQRLLSPPLNPLPVLIGYSIDGDETLRVVRRLLEADAGVMVLPNAFTALLYSKDIRPETFFQPDKWPVQCFNALVEGFIDQGSSFRNPSMVRACILLMRHPASLFLVLREGLPPEPFFIESDVYYGMTTDREAPSSPEEARLYMLSVFVLARFVDRLYDYVLLPEVEEFCDSPAVRVLVDRFKKTRARVSTLQQLCRVAVRRYVGGNHVQARLHQLGGLLTRPTMDALLYRNEYFEDLSEFRERYHTLED